MHDMGGAISSNLDINKKKIQVLSLSHESIKFYDSGAHSKWFPTCWACKQMYDDRVVLVVKSWFEKVSCWIGYTYVQRKELVKIEAMMSSSVHHGIGKPSAK